MPKLGSTAMRMDKDGRRDGAATRERNGTRDRTDLPLDTIVSGVLGGGLLGVGLGPLGAMGGMVLGGAAGYMAERRLRRGRRSERIGEKAPA